MVTCALTIVFLLELQIIVTGLLHIQKFWSQDPCALSARRLSYGESRFPFLNLHSWLTPDFQSYLKYGFGLATMTTVSPNCKVAFVRFENHIRRRPTCLEYQRKGGDKQSNSSKRKSFNPPAALHPTQRRTTHNSNNHCAFPKPQALDVATHTLSAQSELVEDSNVSENNVFGLPDTLCSPTPCETNVDIMVASYNVIHIATKVIDRILSLS